MPIWPEGPDWVESHRGGLKGGPIQGLHTKSVNLELDL